MSLVVVALLLLPCCFGWRPGAYPTYCGKDLSSRSLPAVTDAQLALWDPTLQQVQVLVRHGSRTPYAKFFCWQGYDVSWNNCNVTELMYPSPSMAGETQPPLWMFRKIYDGSPNMLGGNCFTGQLLQEGYEQEKINAGFLRDQYIGIGKSKLFNTSSYDELKHKTYFRSDDEQRTLMSGQIIVNNVFDVSANTIIPWHTGDYSLDTIYPNNHVCPNLDEVLKKSQRTDEFLTHNRSADVTTLVEDLGIALGNGWSFDHALDCFMTTLCTGRELPAGMSQRLLDQAIEYTEWSFAYTATWNNSQWSKLALGHIVYQVRTHIEAMINQDKDEPKFVLYSGHDTTLMPFLGCFGEGVWDKKWAGYASMIVIELWQAGTSTQEWLVRFIYNGDPLLLPGCSDTLCSVEQFFLATKFARNVMPCDVTTSSDNQSTMDDDRTTDLPMRLLAGTLIGATVIGALIGALLTLALLRRIEQNPVRYIELTV